MDRKNALQNLFNEAEAYSSFEAIEELLQRDIALTNHPVQPLYACIKAMSPELAATYLHRFSTEQRQVMLDIDLWHKDEISTQNFSFWISTYSQCPEEEVRLEFIKSEQFALWLKGRVNIWTFDVEEPEYPDHDNYFLTDDSLLLVEFDEDFPYVDELRSFIRELYGEQGVEMAYTYLFKIVSDSYSSLAEEEYRFKKSRMSDYGFVDYYDALALVSPFQKIELIDAFIKKMAPATGDIDEVAEGQALHYSALSAYRQNMDTFYDELDKLNDEKRKKFVNFDFIRLVNSTMTLDEALQAGPVAMAKVGKKSKTLLLLGINYIRQQLGESLPEGIFSRFIFSDLYKIGYSLILFVQRELKKELQKNGFSNNDEAFLGKFWNDFLELSFEQPVKFATAEGNLELSTYSLWSEWRKESHQLISLLPFIKQIYLALGEIRSKGQIINQFYLNYAVEEIDFESIIISQFSRHLIASDSTHQMKLGLTIQETKLFFKSVIDDTGHLRTDADFCDQIKVFVKSTGLDAIDGIVDYLLKIMVSHLEGYAVDEMDDRDFTHIGGVMILDTLKQ